MYDELVKRLRERAQRENDYFEHGGDIVEEAADAIEELTGFVQEAERDRDEYRERLDKANDAIEKLHDALLLMVLQYCTTDDGFLYHSFMSAGENAFAVLGVENGQKADLLWDRVLNEKSPKEK